MPNYNQTLKTNNSSLEEIITQLNNMPDAGAGTELPTLTNEGSASDLLSGKQLIDGDGNVVTGTIPTQEAKTITPSTSSQTAVASGRYTTGAVTVAPIPSNYEDVATETTEYTSLNNELEEVINSLPSGSSTGINVETIDVKIHFNDGKNQTSKMMDIFGTFVQNNTVSFSDSILSKTEDDNKYHTYKCAYGSVLILCIPTTQYTLTSTALYEPYPISLQCEDVIGVDIEGASPIDIYITI